MDPRLREDDVEGQMRILSRLYRYAPELIEDDVEKSKGPR